MTTRDLKSRLNKNGTNKFELKIEFVQIDSIKPYPGNPRIHCARQIRKLAANMRANTFLVPIHVGPDNCIVAGALRWEAAKLAGFREVPVIRLPHLSTAQLKAWRLFDNRIAHDSKWDVELLAIELQSILQIEPSFNIEETGFSIDEVELTLDGAASRGAARSDDDEIPEPIGPAVTRLGDLWLLGDHKLYCGDATQWASYATLLGRERAEMIFTDPPYGVPIQGHVSGLGKHRHREFVQASGEMTEREYQLFLIDALTMMRRASRNGSLHYVFIDWRHVRVLLVAGEGVYDKLINLCVWAKSNAGMSSLYRSQHELICVFKNGTRAHVNRVELGKHGRSRSNVWQYPGANSFSKTRDEDLAMHPTVKSLSLVADAILDVTEPGELVLDPFGGSGTTLMAAEQTARVARVMELDPLYCDVILRRFETKTGNRALHESTGKTFAEIAQMRGKEEIRGS